MRSVTLGKNEIVQCVSFGERFASAIADKSDRDFGGRQVEARGRTDKTADTIAGKLAEVAFKKFCYEHDITTELDFGVINGQLNIDNGQDIALINSVALDIKYDIKGAKKFASWLIVESHKIDEDIICADIYVFVKLDLPSNSETNLEAFNVDKIDAEIAGFAFKEDFLMLLARHGSSLHMASRSSNPG